MVGIGAGLTLWRSSSIEAGSGTGSRPTGTGMTRRTCATCPSSHLTSPWRTSTARRDGHRRCAIVVARRFGRNASARWRRRTRALDSKWPIRQQAAGRVGAALDCEPRTSSASTRRRRCRVCEVRGDTCPFTPSLAAMPTTTISTAACAEVDGRVSRPLLTRTRLSQVGGPKARGPKARP